MLRVDGLAGGWAQGGFSRQERGRYQEVDVLIGVAMWPVRPHGPQPHEGEGDRPHCLSQPVGERVYVPCEGRCIFQRPLGRFTEVVVSTRGGGRTDPVALRTWMVSEFSNDVTIAFGCRITFPLQSRCATIAILVPWLVVTSYFVCKVTIPDDGVRVELVGNVRVGVKPPGRRNAKSSAFSSAVVMATMAPRSALASSTEERS